MKLGGLTGVLVTQNRPSPVPPHSPKKKPPSSLCFLYSHAGLYRGSYSTLRVSKSSMNCWSRARTLSPANRRYSSMVDVSDQRCTFRRVPTKQPVRCLPCEGNKVGLPCQRSKENNWRTSSQERAQATGVSKRDTRVPLRKHSSKRQASRREPNDVLAWWQCVVDTTRARRTLLQWMSVGWLRTSSNACNASRMAYEHATSSKNEMNANTGSGAANNHLRNEARGQQEAL